MQCGGAGVRWLLENVVGDEIPVAIYKDIGIEKAGTGLNRRPVKAGDVIRVKNDFNPDLIIAKQLAQRAAIHDGRLNNLFKKAREVESGTQLPLF